MLLIKVATRDNLIRRELHLIDKTCVIVELEKNQFVIYSSLVRRLVLFGR